MICPTVRFKLRALTNANHAGGQALVTVTFKPDGTGTILTLLHERFFDAEARDRHQHGWAGALVKLEKMFA